MNKCQEGKALYTLKQAIKVLTAQAGITQSELANKLEVVQPVLSRTINKPDHRITTDLLPIAKALGCKLELHFIREEDGQTAAIIPYPAEEQ